VIVDLELTFLGAFGGGLLWFHRVLIFLRTLPGFSNLSRNSQSSLSGIIIYSGGAGELFVGTSVITPERVILRGKPWGLAGAAFSRSISITNC
jgi:hypothetical protein